MVVEKNGPLTERFFDNRYNGSPMKNELDDLFGAIGSNIEHTWRAVFPGKVERKIYHKRVLSFSPQSIENNALKKV